MIDTIKILKRKAVLKFYSNILRRKEFVAKFSKSKMVFPFKSSRIGRWMHIYKTREPDQALILSWILSEGNFVLDIGANIGYYILIESEYMNNKGTILAYEPDPRNIEYLNRNISLNGLKNVVEVFNVAVSDKNGYKDFFLCEHANLNSFEKSELPRGYIGKQKIEVVALREVLKQKPSVADLLRMDLEGHELHIFRSLINFIKNEDGFNAAPRYILFETHPWEYKDKQKSVDLLKELFTLGYNVKYLTTKRENISPFYQYGYYPINTFKWNINYYGIYQDIDAELGAELICNNNEIRTACFQKKILHKHEREQGV